MKSNMSNPRSTSIAVFPLPEEDGEIEIIVDEDTYAPCAQLEAVKDVGIAESDICLHLHVIDVIMLLFMILILFFEREMIL